MAELGGEYRRRCTYDFHGGVDCHARYSLIEVPGTRIDFPEGEHAYKVESTGIQYYYGVCRGIQLVEEDLNQYEFGRMKCAL
jgi:hypothetical protein